MDTCGNLRCSSSSTEKSMRSSSLRPSRRCCAPEEFGHTIVNTNVDRPWSQYFCCMLAGSADYVNRYPVATKRVLRAILKAADFCASNPALAAQATGRSRFLPNYDYALATLNDTQHDKWRDYDPEDSVRFYALRMQETGMIKSSPQTDHRERNGLGASSTS